MRIAADLARLLRYRELVATLLVRDLKVRYRQTALGALWAIIQPVSMAVVLSAVFSPFIAPQTGEKSYFLFVYTGVLCWNLCAAAMSFGVQSIVGHASLLTKVAFPREVFPLSAAVVNLVDYLVGLAVLLIAMVFVGHPLHLTLLLLPLPLFAEMLLACGLALILSAANVFFRDIRFVIPLATMIWMFLTPVFYPASRLSARMHTVVAYNPMTYLVELHRRLLLDGQFPGLTHLGVAFAGCALVFVVSYSLFKRWEPYFAEVV